MTRSQFQRLQRDVLHGTVTKEDYLMQSGQEYFFGIRLFDELHSDAERFLRSKNSPYAGTRPPSIQHNAWFNSKTNALNDAKKKVLKVVVNNE